MNSGKNGTNFVIVWDDNYLSPPRRMDGLEQPFPDKEGVRKSLEYFSTEARKKDVNVFITNFRACKGNRLSKAFLFDDGSWRKVDDVKVDVLYNKIGEDIDIREYVSSDVEIVVPIKLRQICSDKYRLFNIFSEHMPRTLLFDKGFEVGDLESKIGSKKVVVKPRWGHGGEDVNIFDMGVDGIEDIKDFLLEKKRGSFIIQEFKDSRQGIPGTDIRGVHDLRLIMVNGKVSYSFVRQPETGYISNVGQGGKIIPFDIDDLQPEVIDIAYKIDEKIKDIDKRIYSIDLLFDSEGKAWVIELNSKPGIGFSNQAVIEHKKEFIRDIIDVLIS